MLFTIYIYSNFGFCPLRDGLFTFEQCPPADHLDRRRVYSCKQIYHFNCKYYMFTPENVMISGK